MSLDGAKLTSIDHNGDRIYIIPAEVRGFFRRHRDWSQILLLVIFLVLPWTSLNGHQTVLLNIPNREFALFGVLFRAHDAPLLFFILGMLALGLAFVTSIWGRVWCGWACPQTVFIDAVYRRIEMWVEGNYIQRRKLRDEPLTPKAFLKKSIKWFLFVIVSSLIAHSFIAYFVGANNLLAMMGHPPSENWTYFGLVMFFTAITLFDFAWFREQFCVIMCPYGRIQSVLLDHSSMAVVYNSARGEPRKGAAIDSKKTGDCVNCNRCVQVCPTGIDIRNGLQMDCIACTSCIDACDEIMDKVNKPRGLIAYNTLDGSKLTLKKPRAILYMLAIFGLFFGLTYALSTRSSVHAALLRAPGLPYSFVKDEANVDKVLNHFKLHIQNQGGLTAEYKISLTAEAEKKNIQLIVAQNPIRLEPGGAQEWHFFLRFDEKELSAGTLKTQLSLIDLQNSEAKAELKEITLIGPKRP